MFYVIYACNDNYAKLAGVSLFSLLKNNRDIDSLSIGILDDNISCINKKKLQNTAELFNREIIFFNVDEKIAQLKNDINPYGNAADSKTGGYTAYARLFISEYLPNNIQKVIYIDCDTLINNSIKDLVNFSMDNKSIALAYDCFRKEYKQYIQYPDDYPYYNSGVVLIDIKNWKKYNCTQQILMHLREKKRYYPLVDQDILNIVLKDHIQLLPLRYNVLSQCFLYNYSALKYVYGLKTYYKKSEFVHAKSQPAIYHFCGQTFGRPWFSNSKHPIKALYDSYYYESEWKDEKQATYNWKIEYKIQYILYRWFPKCCAAFIGMLMQRIFIFITYKK